MVVARRGVYIERGDVKRLAFESPVRSLAPNKNGGIALLITLLNVFGKPFLAHGQAQNRSPLKQGQLFCTFGGLLRDLHSARTSADDGDPAARKIDTLLRPSRRVTPIAFERRDSWHIGNIRLRCESQSGQKEVCRYSFPALKLQAPPSSLFIEPCALDPRSHPHKRPKAQRIANMPEIGSELLPSGKALAPGP